MGRADEVVEAPDDWEYSGPKPPPRGSLAYRRMVILIGAAETYDEFHDRLQPPWEWLGWRLGLDVMTEMLYHLSRSWVIHYRSGHRRDAFGRINLREFVHVFTDEQRLRYAARMGNTLYPELPKHQAFKKSMLTGEKVWQQQETLIPVWQQALNTIEANGGKQEPAWPGLLKHLSRNGDRLSETNEAVGILHASLRGHIMPGGEAWVDSFLRDEMGTSELVSGSLAFHERIGEDPKLFKDHMPGWWEYQDETTGRPRSRQPGCTCGGWH